MDIIEVIKFLIKRNNESSIYLTIECNGVIYDQNINESNNVVTADSSNFKDEQFSCDLNVFSAHLLERNIIVSFRL